MTKHTWLLSLFIHFILFCASCKENNNINNREGSQIGNVLRYNQNSSSDYGLSTTKDFSTRNGARLEIRITVNEGLNLYSLENTIKKAIAKTYYDYGKPKAISALVYKKGQSTNGQYSVAKANFAPYGDWSNTSYGDLNTYEIKIQHNESYFDNDEEVKVLIPNGSEVRVFNGTKYALVSGQRKEIKTNTVDIFSSPKNLTSEHKIGEIPNNSNVVIIDVYSQDLPQNAVWTTYKVKFKNLEGWVFDFNLKSR